MVNKTIYIVTVTHNRLQLLLRAITSVLKQTYTDFEMIIIDDSSNNETYKHMKKTAYPPKIKYIKNISNMGANYSKNTALSFLSQKKGYVLFLDDDDFLNQNCLNIAVRYIKETKANWLISNRKNMLKSNIYSRFISYVNDYLCSKRISGEATHIINLDIINSYQLRFLKNIKNGYEFTFFSKLSYYTDAYIYDYDSTITNGYLIDGLSNNISMKFSDYLFLIKEIIYLRNKLSEKTKIIILTTLLFLSSKNLASSYWHY